MCAATTSHSNLFSTYRFYHKLDLTILTPTATMEPLPYLTFLITLLVSAQGHSDGPPIKVSDQLFLWTTQSKINMYEYLSTYF